MRHGSVTVVFAMCFSFLYFFFFVDPTRYVNQILDSQFDEMITTFLQLLRKFELRAREKNPIKARMNRRYAAGLREIAKGVKLKTISLVIMAPNIEKIEAPGV